MIVNFDVLHASMKNQIRSEHVAHEVLFAPTLLQP
jgi:hypothetical protein